MPKNTIKRVSVFLGIRVEISPSHDLWMQGARFGTIRKIDTARGLATVKMDHPQVKRLQVIRVMDLSARSRWVLALPEMPVQTARTISAGQRLYLFDAISTGRLSVRERLDPYDPRQHFWIYADQLECEPT